MIVEKHILVIEDEVTAAKSLVSQLNELGYHQVTVCRNDKETLSVLKNKKIQLALVDIGLTNSNLNGIELAKRINKKMDIPIVFMTSFSDKASIQNASESNYFDYLVKPVSLRQLFVVLERAFSHNRSMSLTSKTISGCPFNTTKNKFFIKKGDGFADGIHIDNFLYAQADKGYVSIFTIDKEYVLSASLESFLKQFPHPDIIRVHRSFAVNINKVMKRSDRELKLTNRKTIPFSRTHRKSIEDHFGALKAD